ncbi:MAG: HlyD family type I secretion periplasmic adaptor subunit [Gammaproteobacteria bacterium]
MNNWRRQVTQDKAPALYRRRWRKTEVAGEMPGVEPPTPAPVTAEHLPSRPQTRGPVAAGLAIILVFFGGFGAWAALAPLSSAAIAPGAVRVEGNRKTVQHLEGGIIAELRVRDGDAVERGQLLIRLDPTQAKARFEAQLNQYLTLQSEKARLIAERDGFERIVFPPALLSLRDRPRVIESITSQKRIFDTRRRSLKGRISIFEQRVEQLRSQGEGLVGQVRAEDSQIALIDEEIVGAQQLFDQGLEGNVRLLELKRAAAALAGSRAGHLAAIAQSEQAIGETKLEIINARDEYDAETAAALKDVQVRLAENAEALRATRDILRRTDIRAPIAGVVMNTRFFTVGGVVEPGKPLLDIVPQNDELVAEVQVSPLDIDVVTPGLPAQVRLTAFKARKTPVLNGLVTHVSADSLVDEQTGVAYYQALIEIDAQELARLTSVKLYPGMPLEGLVITGTRTFWNYLIRPLTDSFAHAFREQ